jgi:membrane fusion protein, multidrug efflux system
MNRKKFFTAAVCVVGLIIVLIWVQGGFRRKIQGGTTPIPGKASKVNAVEAKLIKTSGSVIVSGTVISQDTARVAARIQGYVVELLVDAGDKVKKGQVLLRIDTKEMAERLDQAKANLDSAKADFTNAQNDYERYKALYEKQSIAKKDYDDAQAKYEVARAAEQRAQAAVDQAKTTMSYGVVTAPFNGIVSQRDVNVGDLATPGKTLLTIYKPGTLELVAPVPENYAPYLKVRSPVQLAVPSINLTRKSKIREVVPQRNEKTRTITVKAPISEAPGLGPGLYGTIKFDTVASRAIVVPERAVHTFDQLESVEVLHDGVVQVRHVRTGRILSKGRIEILSGLVPGEKVVD